ncbi:Sec-independent protein translocase protein TatB [Dietzia sp. UBA5065]|uniref:Sec-independent protein translocase protein TatB n=1 Tax=Dietzia sp. UBA5065 TaxID=1946422 RepID=UPI0025C60CFC|nr:Sec-independent protein translocase protein TatB [Dietzia sp. UBA5065]
MFTNVGWSELLVLGVIALVVLGPERLPEAARWLASAIRKVKEFAGSAQQQLRDDYGTEFEEFREPLKQLNELRGLNPRAMVTKHLLDGDDSLFTGDFGAAAPAGGAAVAGTPTTGPRPQAAGPAASPPPQDPRPSGATPEWDPDAT